MSSSIGKRAVVTSTMIASLVGSGLALAPDASAAVNYAPAAVKVAKSKIGDPYYSGATGPNSFDCSGLTQYSYKKAGKKISRTAQQQYNTTTHIAWKNRKPGDLVFFSYKGTHHVYHVGIYIGVINHHSTMIAAPYSGAKVRKEVIYSKYWESHASISFGRVK
jgi:cell wall-associated NlpC family hydrolase